MPTQKHFPRLRREPLATKDAQWGQALPAIARLLADRRADVALPTCPLLRADEDVVGEVFARAIAYWSALDHLLRYQLGWTHPAQGLARWRDEGGGSVSTALALVRYVWLGDGFLDRAARL